MCMSQSQLLIMYHGWEDCTQTDSELCDVMCGRHQLDMENLRQAHEVRTAALNQQVSQLQVAVFLVSPLLQHFLQCYALLNHTTMSSLKHAACPIAALLDAW